jgi:four helix bundle protein
MEEANGAESKPDFIHKVSIAYKEARETRFWLATIQAAILPDSAEVAGLHKECDEIVRILYTIRKTARLSLRTPRYR